MTRERAVVTRVERALTFDQVTAMVTDAAFFHIHYYCIRTASSKWNKGDIVWVRATAKGLEIE